MSSSVGELWGAVGEGDLMRLPWWGCCDECAVVWRGCCWWEWCGGGAVGESAVVGWGDKCAVGEGAVMWVHCGDCAVCECCEVLC